jgi:hypothetical protein
MWGPVPVLREGAFTDVLPGILCTDDHPGLELLTYVSFSLVSDGYRGEN